MRLIITIDTEEDNWGSYSPTEYSLENIEKIPILQNLFDKFNIKPTYLITYPVATDDRSISILQGILREGKCEIGTHCHPWNTPPFKEESNERNSMLCNLSADLQFGKLTVLHKAIMENFGIQPITFRAGRWGYNMEVAKNLSRLGYKIDTSITPYTDWANYQGPDFSNISPRPFKFSVENIFNGSSNGQMIEVPATIGFTQQNFELCSYILRIFSKRPIARLKIVGILNKLNLLNKVWLSPENSDSKNMIKLTKCMLEKGYNLLNMIFHSSTLKAGLTPFVRTKDDEKRFLGDIKEFLIFARDAGIEPIKPSDYLKLL